MNPDTYFEIDERRQLSESRGLSCYLMENVKPLSEAELSRVYPEEKGTMKARKRAKVKGRWGQGFWQNHDFWVMHARWHPVDLAMRYGDRPTTWANRRFVVKTNHCKDLFFPNFRGKKEPKGDAL